MASGLLLFWTMRTRSKTRFFVILPLLFAGVTLPSHAGVVIPFPGGKRPPVVAPAAESPVAESCEATLTFKAISDLPRAARLGYSLQSLILNRPKNRDWESADSTSVRYHAEIAAGVRLLKSMPKNTLALAVNDHGYFVAIHAQRYTEGDPDSEPLELLRQFSDDLLAEGRVGINIYFGMRVPRSSLGGYRAAALSTVMRMKGFSLNSELNTAASELTDRLPNMKFIKPINGYEHDGGMNLDGIPGQPDLIWQTVRFTLDQREIPVGQLRELINLIEQIAKGHLGIIPVE